MPRITPNLWFDTNGLEAAGFYVSVFPNSGITKVTYYGESGMREAGTVMTVEFHIDGQPVVAINGGPQFTFSEAVSMLIECADQEEVDYYWDRLTAGGGEPGRCGWLKDQFGFSWQVVPVEAIALFTDSDPALVERVMTAMLQMGKLDLAALQAAAAAG